MITPSSPIVLDALPASHLTDQADVEDYDDLVLVVEPLSRRRVRIRIVGRRKGEPKWGPLGDDDE